jgi:hypothetical protein
MRTGFLYTAAAVIIVAAGIWLAVLALRSGIHGHFVYVPRVRGHGE